MGKDKPKSKDFVRRNDQIRVPQVLLVHEERNLGIMSSYEALMKARAVGLDLVEVAPHAKPPVCSIMDYGKYMFERQKKMKSKQAGLKKEKEVCFRYVTDEHDLETKANQVRKFLEKDMRVKLMVKFKQRENIHKDQGFIVIKKVLAMVEDIAIIEKPPVLEGTTIVARLDAKKGNKHELHGSARRAEGNFDQNSSKPLGQGNTQIHGHDSGSSEVA